MTGNVRQTAPELTWGTLQVTCYNSPTGDGTGPQNGPEGTEDMKSIDRLRDYVCSAPMSSMTNVARAIVVGMTDEIEREAKELADERDLLKTQWEAGVDFDQRLEACADKREDVTLFGVDYMALPLDADGEAIHAGDVLDGYGKTIEVVELRTGRSGWVLISRDGNGYADCAAFSHHHAPTVEDVLREFADAWAEWKDGAAMMNPVERYAAKLRLAGEDE